MCESSDTIWHIQCQNKDAVGNASFVWIQAIDLCGTHLFFYVEMDGVW